jgi:hypothetical protein
LICRPGIVRTVQGRALRNCLSILSFPSNSHDETAEALHVLYGLYLGISAGKALECLFTLYAVQSHSRHRPGFVLWLPMLLLLFLPMLLLLFYQY